MKKYLFLFFLLLGVASGQTYDTCVVSGTVYDMRGRPAAYAQLTVHKVTALGTVPVLSSNPQKFQANRDGYIVLRLLRNSIDSICGDVQGFQDCKNVTIPNTATANLYSLVTASNIPNTYTLAGGAWAKVGSDSLFIYPTLEFSDAFQIKADAGGRVVVRRDPDSVAAATGITPATLKDSLDVETTIGTRLANRIRDSLDANPRAAIFDSTAIHQRSHTWTARQRYVLSLAAGETYIPLSLQGWTNPNAYYGLGIQRNDFGSNIDYIFRIGYNPFRENTTEPELVWQWESNYFNSDSLLEMHLAAVGQNSLSSRWITGIGRRSTGRNIDLGFNTGKVYFGDSAGLHPQFVRIDGASRVIDLDTATIRVLQANQSIISGYNGTQYSQILGTAGSTIVDLGGAAWTQARITAGTKTFTAHGTGGYFYLPNGSWGADTLIATSKGYVDTRLASAGGVTVTQLSDSLDANPRGGAGGISTAVLSDSLNANPRRDNGKLNITALTDTLSANVTRGAALLAANLDDSLSTLVSAGARSISSTGRMFVSDDSISFVGEAGDVVNCALGNVFRGTLSANDTISFTGMVDGQIVSIVITNAGTNTLAWTGVNWAGGTIPTLSATANKRDVFTIIQAGGILYGSVVQDLR